jgi:hypothetical protein
VHVSQKWEVVASNGWTDLRGLRKM